MNIVNRKLTGNWYLKKCLFGYKIMVEVTFNIQNSIDISNSPIQKQYEKAKSEDLLELNIKTLS